MDALIIANGVHPSAGIVRKLAREAKLIVCADGGAAYAARFRIRPAIIIGDLDSISRAARMALSGVPLLYVDDQESTDLEKAVRYCLASGCHTIAISGALGGRIDHSTGALGIFKRFRGLCDLTLVDELGTLTLLPRRATIRTRPGEHLSLIPLDRCRGISTTNLLYPLRNESLQLGVREGISNMALRRHVSIRHSGGTLLLYRFHGHTGGARS